MLVDVEAASGPGSEDRSPPPSQLLRDLDNCNSDPVAVASCFVERVRGAGCSPLVLLCWGLRGTGTPTFLVPLSFLVPHVLSGTGRVFLGGQGSLVDGTSQADGYEDGSAQLLWGQGQVWVYNPKGVSLKSLFFGFLRRVKSLISTPSIATTTPSESLGVERGG